MDASDPIKPYKALVPRGPSTYGSRVGASLARDTKAHKSPWPAALDDLGGALGEQREADGATKLAGPVRGASL
jgi:hypothetical protein